MIATDAGAYPRWSADGKRLFYVSGKDELMAVDVQAGSSFQITPPRRVLGGVTLGPWSLSPTGDRFLFSRLSFSAGPPPPFTLALNWMGKLER